MSHRAKLLIFLTVPISIGQLMYMDFWNIIKELKNYRYYIYLILTSIFMYILQGVPGGMCQTSGGCSLC